MKSQNYRSLILKNGLKIYLQKTPTETISFCANIYHGPVNEKKGEEGSSHFLEHTTMTGGTEKYSPEEIEKMKWYLTTTCAYTTLHKNAYTGIVLPEDFETLLDYFSQIIFHPRFDPKKFEEERQRIIREISEIKSKPDFKDMELLRELIAGKDHPLNKRIFGEESIVTSATINDIKTFRSRGYVPNNMNIIIVGNIQDNTEKLIRKYFEKERKGPVKRYVFPKPEKLIKKEIIQTYAGEMLNKEHPQESNIQIMFYFQVPPISSKENYILRVLTNIPSQRIFMKLSQEKGLVYTPAVNYVGSFNVGYIYIIAKVKHDRKDEAINALFKELELFKNEKVNSYELELVKKRVRLFLAVTFENNEGLTNTIIVKTEEGQDFRKELSYIKKVTSEEIIKCARKYLPEQEKGKYILMLRDPFKKDFSQKHS